MFKVPGCVYAGLLCSSPGMVDVVFADVAQPDQTRIVALNAHNFLKNGGHFVISIKVCQGLQWMLTAHFSFSLAPELTSHIYINNICRVDIRKLIRLSSRRAFDKMWLLDKI